MVTPCLPCHTLPPGHTPPPLSHSASPVTPCLLCHTLPPPSHPASPVTPRLPCHTLPPLALACKRHAPAAICCAGFSCTLILAADHSSFSATRGVLKELLAVVEVSIELWASDEEGVVGRAGPSEPVAVCVVCVVYVWCVVYV